MSDDQYGMKLRYNRERRLERATPDVRALYERRAGGKRGFLSFLRGNRNLSVLFLTIVVFAVIGSLYAFLSRESGGRKVGAYQAVLEAKLEGGDVVVNLKLSSNAFFGRKAVDTVLVRTSTDGKTFSAREFALSGSKTDLFYFRVPVETEPTQIECLISVGGSQIDVTVPLRGAERY